MFKKSIATLATLIALSLTTTSAYSGDRVLTGTILGAGGGALLGQAIGGDADSVLIGTALGGIVGLTASSASHRYTSSRVHFGYSNYDRRHYGHKRYHHPTHRYLKHKRHYNHSRHYRSAPQCRVVVKHVYSHGHSYKVKKRICNVGGHKHYKKGRHGHKRGFNSHPRHHRW